ncbi:thioredoxin family protein [Maritimibacter sp. UBA3975]|uniref:thioredoxin family protein n=1 Tax=Maritimibacter sp. UBA3975 TaxID=1946833 RepID=UPI000C09BBB4|nr:thioredoxin family protein [Maritimibacter sp. UBA3975]MAM63301.1 thiol reductase thioredoxin [Maritimibacter sp.]|tara:strand:- start:44635 stop:45048 length:414 start_codon:yes stop_codon:yes gene_type:complete
MNRRAFLATASAAALIPALAQAATIAYTPGAVDRALAAGQPVVLDYFAPWCGTCQAQRRVIARLMDENPAYKDKVTYIEVDWDTYKRDAITTSRQVPRRSTLIALGPDGSELARIVAGTSYEDIKSLFDAALATAST